MVGPDCADKSSLNWVSDRAPDGLALWEFPTILDAAALITTGQCDVVLVVARALGSH